MKTKHKHEWEQDPNKVKTEYRTVSIKCKTCPKVIYLNEKKTKRALAKGCFGKPIQHPIYNPEKVSDVRRRKRVESNKKVKN